MNNKIKSLILKLFGEAIFAKFRVIYWVGKLKRGGFYENEIDLLPHFVHLGSVCIDIGANFGQYTYPLSKLVGSSGKVFSFEPVRCTFEILKNIIRKLKLSNVEVRNIALGDIIGEVRFITPISASGIKGTAESHIYSQGEGVKGIKEKAKITTLDELRLRLPILNRVTFIKCDVEGAELMVFRGGKTFLSKYHPVILCEIEERHTKRYKYKPEKIFSFLESLGYKAFIYSFGKLVLIQRVQEFTINHVFIHESLADKYIYLI